MNKVLIQADANSKMGVGHVMRCVALAQYLKEQNVYVRFLSEIENPNLAQYLKDQKFDIHLIPYGSVGGDQKFELLLKEIVDGFDWVISDYYRFGEIHHKKISEMNVKLLVISDAPPYSKYADLVLNHALQESSSSRRLLLGTQYALIRQELIETQKDKKRGSQNLLVTLGGGLHSAVLEKIIKSIHLITQFKLKVKIISGFSPELKNMDIRRATHEIEYSTNPLEIHKLYDWADLSISAGGGTSWELCFFGIVGLIGILAENQIPIVQQLNQNGVFKSVGWYRDQSETSLARELNKFLSDAALIPQMRSRAQGLVDGKGPQRIFEAMKKVQRVKLKT